VGALSRQCAGITRDGRRCTRSVEGPNGYCWLHDPKHGEERRRAASRAGKAKGNKEVATLKEEIKSVIAEVKAGVLDRNDAAVMIQGYRALKDFIALERQIKETEELEERIRRLEESTTGGARWGA
jgi:hypothetical protein